MKFIFCISLLSASSLYATEDLRACRISDECVIVVEKCGHIGINKKFLKEHQSHSPLSLENCIGFVDPQRFDMIPACIKGQCEAVVNRK